MIEPVRYKVSIRVTDDEKHAIAIDDFDEFEETLIDACLNRIGCYVDFRVRFFPVLDWMYEEDGRDVRTDDDEPECS